MIINTIAADRQLAGAIREESLTSEATGKPTEKSYLRSQFERRQKRQIGLTNKMHRNRPGGEGAESGRPEQQQQQARQEEQPDSVVRSHELIKRRFFEELERRESINSARVAATHKQEKLNEQQQQQQLQKQKHAASADPLASVLPDWPHHNQQQPITQLWPSKGEEADFESLSDVKADINEPDGAGTDADEATSLETIITNNPKSSIAAAPPPPPPTAIAGNLYEPAAGGALSLAPLLDNSVPVQQVESGEGTSYDHDDVGASTRSGEDVLEQTGQSQPTRSSSMRRASKARDLQAGAPRSASDCELEQGHGILLLHRSVWPQRKLQQQRQEQYANPGPVESDSARGSHESESELLENNVNHDHHKHHNQYDGHHEILKGSQGSAQVQVFAGMRLEGLESTDESGKERRAGINLFESGCRSCSTSGHDLVSSNEQQQQQQVLHHKLAVASQPLAQIVQPQASHHSEQQAMVCNDSETGQGHGGGASFLANVASALERGAQEEDARSSCSSSGFGASVSAGSSAASSSSEGRRGHGHHRNRHHLHIDRRPQAGEALNNHCNDDDQLARRRSQVVLSADDIAQFEIVVGRLDGVGECGNAAEQTLSVGMEQSQRENDKDDDDDDDAYCKMVHVENHGYGALGSGERRTITARTKTTRNQTDKRRWPLLNPDDLSNELDLYLNRQYVNLPAEDRRDSPERPLSAPRSMETGANVEYATVRARPNKPPANGGSSVNLVRGQANSGAHQLEPAEANNENSTSRNPNGSLIKFSHYPSGSPAPHAGAAQFGHAKTDDCGSEHNSSASSSGGFSKLPPVRLIDHNFANNLQSSSASATGKAPPPPPSSSSSSWLMESSNSIGRSPPAAACQSSARSKSTSLLKRFGSLVSRAFTSANNSAASSSEFTSSHGVSVDYSNRAQNFSGGAHLNRTGMEPLDNQRRRPLSSRIQSGPHSSLSVGIPSEGGIPSLREHKSMDLTGGRRESPLRGHHQDHGSDRSQGQASTPASQQRQQQQQEREGSVATCTKSLALAEADLVILSEKHHSRDHNKTTTARSKRPVTMTGGAPIHHQHYEAAGSRSSRLLEEVPLLGGQRQDEKLLISWEKCCQKSARHHSNPKTNKSAHEPNGRFSTRRSTSSASCCSSFSSSLDNSSTSVSSIRNTSHQDENNINKRQTKQRARSYKNKLRRASSLSDELESPISPSEVGSSSQQNCTDELDFGLNPCDTTDGRMSQTAFNRHGKLSSIEASVRASALGRFGTRWFSVNGGSTGGGCSNEDLASNIQYEPRSWASSSRALRESSRRQPKSLIDHNHASSDHKLNIPLASNKRNSSNLDSTSKARFEASEIIGRNLDAYGRGQQQQPTSLVYTSLNLAQSSPLRSADRETKHLRDRGQLCLQPDGSCDSINNGGGGGEHAASKQRDDELVVNNGKCQSLNLYQNLLRSYVKRRSHNQHRHHRHHHRGHSHNHHHHHHHHHHRHANSSSHHHHHHHHRSSSSRHAHCSSSATRCGQRCSSPTCCENSSDLQQQAAATRVSPSSGKGRTDSNQAGVWGQLIKIKKSDGSQVIELQRDPNRSWGFFVARGAINNTKGIFISRMHNSSTGNSLNGLLSVGDRILSIDNYAIEPDFDILRVNQMISKKSKIHLEVKPFRG